MSLRSSHSIFKYRKPLTDINATKNQNASITPLALSEPTKPLSLFLHAHTMKWNPIDSKFRHGPNSQDEEIPFP